MGIVCRGRFRSRRRARRRAAARRELVSRMPPAGVGAEIGVWKGDFTAQLLSGARPAKLHLIDPWTFQPEFGRSWFGGTVAKSQADMDAIYAEVTRRFAAEIASGQAEIHRASSLEASKRFEPETLDWVYIDGNHDYPFVLDDLRAYTALVKPGGYLMGDDYGPGGWWRGGVKRAVDEWVAQGACRLVAIREDQFLLQRPVAPDT